MGWHTARKLFAAPLEPLEQDSRDNDDGNLEPLEWVPGEEGIEEWVTSSGAEYLGYREPDLVNSGTPSFLVHDRLRPHLMAFPMHHIDCGGASVHIVADDGEGIIWLEDWLSGCLPKSFSDEGFGYGDPIVAEYIDKAVDSKVDEIGQKLGAEWRLQSVDSNSESDQPASRAIWIKNTTS